MSEWEPTPVEPTSVTEPDEGLPATPPAEAKGLGKLMIVCGTLIIIVALIVGGVIYASKDDDSGRQRSRSSSSSSGDPGLDHMAILGVAWDGVSSDTQDDVCLAYRIDAEAAADQILDSVETADLSASEVMEFLDGEC